MNIIKAIREMVSWRDNKADNIIDLSDKTKYPASVLAVTSLMNTALAWRTMMRCMSLLMLILSVECW